MTRSDREWIYKLPIRAESKFLLLYIADHEGEPLSHTKIKDLTLRSKSSFGPALRTMEAQGWILVEGSQDGARYYKGDNFNK